MDELKILKGERGNLPKTLDVNSIYVTTSNTSGDGSYVSVFLQNKEFVSKDYFENIIIDNEETIANAFSKIQKNVGLNKNLEYEISDGEIIANSSSISDSIKKIDDSISNLRLIKESDLEYTLYLKDTYCGSINIPKDLFLKDVDYDKIKKEIIFTFETLNGEINKAISINDLVDIYTNGNGILLNNKEFSIDTDIVATKSEVIANEEVISNALNRLNNSSGFDINGKFKPSNDNSFSASTTIKEALEVLDANSIKNERITADIKNNFVKTNSDASLKSIQLSDGTNTSKVYTMTEGGVPTTYLENENNGRFYISGKNNSLGQIILDANNIHPWSKGGYGNMGTAGNPWAYTYSNNVYTDRLASKNGTLWVQGLINSGNPNNNGIIDKVYFKANDVCPGSKDSNNNLGTSSFPWKTLNAIEATIGKANGAYNQSTITKGVLKFQNSTNSNTTIQPSATSGITLNLPSQGGTIALTSQIPTIPSTIEYSNQIKINEATLDGYYPLTMVESSSNLPKYESLFTKTNIKYNPVQNILETGRVHAHTYTYSEHPENASIVSYNSLDSGSQENIYTSMRPRIGFVYYDNHVDDRYCGQIVMDKNGYTFYRGTSDNSKNSDGTWKGTNDSVYKASNGGTPYAEIKCGEIKAYANNTWRDIISELDSVNTLANNAYNLANGKLSTDLSNITKQGEQKIKDVASTVIPTDTNWYGTQAEFDALTEYQEGVNYYIYD